MMKLRDVLHLFDNSVELPDKWKRFDDIRPNNDALITLCFMCEEETWVKTYSGHPLLIPWYDCEVTSIYATGENEFQIWLKYEPFLKEMLKIEATKEDEA